MTLKPGLGTVLAGLGVGDWYGMAENGILATTAQDLALGHSVLAGAPVPDLATGSHQGLRIGTSIRSPLVGAPPDIDSRAAVDRAAAALAACGHRVSPVRVPYPTSTALTVVLRWYAVAAADAEDIGADAARLQPRTRRHAQLGRLATRFSLVRPGQAGAFRERLPNVVAASRFVPYPAVWNLAGYPAMSIPVGTRAVGAAGRSRTDTPAGVNYALPLAVQMVGAPGTEGQLLAVAAALERELPWQRHAALQSIQGGTN